MSPLVPGVVLGSRVVAVSAGPPLTPNRRCRQQSAEPVPAAEARRSSDDLMEITTGGGVLEHSLPESDRPPPHAGTSLFSLCLCVSIRQGLSVSV